jgi:hypothetical protein
MSVEPEDASKVPEGDDWCPLVADTTSPAEIQNPAPTALSEVRVATLSPRERSLWTCLLAHEEFRSPLAATPVIELRASDDDNRSSFLPNSTRIEVNSAVAAEAQAAVRGLVDGAPAILLHNMLQFLTETRQFLGLCFAKLRFGGVMIVTVPHQFLFERKLRLPSRRNRLHRRFYTPNTLLSDIEEAVDPCEFRVRFLGEVDAGYSYGAPLKNDPEGGQDIVVAIERIARPAWRPELDLDELCTTPREKPSRFPEIRGNEPVLLRTVRPDPHVIGRIILLKLDHRGDFLMAREAFRTFREAFAEAEITLVCGSWNVAEAQASGWFEKVLAFDFFPEDDSARPVRPPRDELIAAFAKEIEGESWDLAVDLRLSDDSRAVLKVINARDRAGFDRLDSFPWLTIRLNTPSATEDDRAEEVVIPASESRTKIGRHRTFEIRSEERGRLPGDEHPVIWGPYRDLEPGRYRFEALIEPLDEEFEVAIDACVDSGRKILFHGRFRVTRDVYPEFPLYVPLKLEKLEVRIRAGDTVDLRPFRFFGIRMVRLGLIRGLHQSEAMTLLAHLVRLRAATPYLVELS